MNWITKAHGHPMCRWWHRWHLAHHTGHTRYSFCTRCLARRVAQPPTGYQPVNIRWLLGYTNAI